MDEHEKIHARLMQAGFNFWENYKTTPTHPIDFD